MEPPQPGELWRAPSVFIAQTSQVLRPNVDNPSSLENIRYRIHSNPPDLFNHRPYYSVGFQAAGLQSDEEIVPVVVKRRPVLVLSKQLPEWNYSGGRLREDVFTVLPLYSFHDDDEPAFVRRIKQWEFPPLIHVPPQPNLGLQEGYFRTDRMYSVARGLMNPMHLEILEDARRIVFGWTLYTFTGQIEDIFLEWRKELMSL